jgi:predicted acyltransferase (DUF342 family)
VSSLHKTRARKLHASVIANQLLNAKLAGAVRQREIQTAEPFVLESIRSEAEVAIGNLKSINNQVLISFQQN